MWRKVFFLGFILKWISLQTWLKGLFVAPAVILTKKRGLERHKIKEITKERKEKTRESEKRSYKKERKKWQEEKEKEKENMEGKSESCS